MTARISNPIDFQMTIAGCGPLSGHAVTWRAPVAGPAWCLDDPIPGPLMLVDCSPLPEGWTLADVASLWSNPASDYFVGHAYSAALGD